MNTTATSKGDAGEPHEPRTSPVTRRRRRPPAEAPDPHVAHSRYTVLDDTKIPTGEIAPVAGTIYDFRAPTPVGEHMDIVPGGGRCDLNFAVHGQQDAFRRQARVKAAQAQFPSSMTCRVISNIAIFLEKL
jgi:hypothetical protein